MNVADDQQSCDDGEGEILGHLDDFFRVDCYQYVGSSSRNDLMKSELYGLLSSYSMQTTNFE